MNLNDFEKLRFEKSEKLGGYSLPEYTSMSIKDIKLHHFNSARVSIDFDESYDYFSVCGRISNIRKSGKICFIKINNGLDYIQIIISAANFTNYSEIGNFDLGDFIEVFGQAVLSKTNEQSVLAKTIKLLTKAITPPPEKYLGISDSHASTLRHVDLMSNIDSRIIFTIRSYIIRAIREYLDKQDFMEVETPVLASNANGAAAKPFQTYHNAFGRNLFLRISPELYLKKLLVGGFPKVYEIGKNFRNEGISNRHNPEFTMLEFYEAYGHFPKLIAYAQDLLSYVNSYLKSNLPNAAKEAYLLMEENRSWCLSEFKQISLEDAVAYSANKMNISLSQDYYVNNDCEVKDMINALNSRGERLLALFESISEPYLVDDYRTSCGKYSVPVFITDYPAEVCPLARVSDKNKNICDRFELFINGQELANAYQELNDPFRQEENFKSQSEESHKEYDTSYIDALKCGLPPAIGFGLGVDRLVTMLTGATSIKNVILFPMV